MTRGGGQPSTESASRFSGSQKKKGSTRGTVSTWLHKLGFKIKSGQHFVAQPPLLIPKSLVGLVSKGPEHVRNFVENQVFGLHSTSVGVAQLEKYCAFTRLHGDGIGVEEVARLLSISRTTVAKWRSGSDLPYLVKIADEAKADLQKGRKLLPLKLRSGGNEFGPWIEVPDEAHDFDDVVSVIRHLRPIEPSYFRGKLFGLDSLTVDSMAADLFAYLLGFMLGDASKLGGEEERFTSVNIDLQLSLRQSSNFRLGEFVCMCVNVLGLRMERITDKQSTGDSRYSRIPVGAFRWNSERSPLLAWAVAVCLGLKWNEDTSHNPVRMDWIFAAPQKFRLRFIQGLADSDGTVKPYEVVLTSTPNAEFTTELLRTLGMTTAHTIQEQGRPLRTMLSRRQAQTLPIFNEFVKGYRYVNLNRPFIR